MREPYFDIHYGRVEVDALTLVTPALMVELIKAARQTGARQVIQWTSEGSYKVLAILNDSGATGNGGLEA